MNMDEINICALELVFISGKTLIMEISNTESLLEQILLYIKDNHNPIINYINVSYIDNNIIYNINNYDDNDDHDYNLQKLIKIISENTYFNINITFSNRTKIDYLYDDIKYSFSIENNENINYIDFYNKFVDNIIKNNIVYNYNIDLIEIKIYDNNTNELLYDADMYYRDGNNHDYVHNNNMGEYQIINKKRKKINIHSTEFRLNIKYINDIFINNYEIYNENEYNRMF